MAYEKLADARIVTLGGIDKKTGKKNPMVYEGYWLRQETRPNKYNPDKPQPVYIFMDQEGEALIYGKGGLNKEMRKAVVGRMTKITDTGKTLDVGKGNPMRVFDVRQDKQNTIEVDELPAAAPLVAQASEQEVPYSYEPEADLEEEAADEVAYAPPVAPRRPTVSPDAARVQALLNKARKQSA